MSNFSFKSDQYATFRPKYPRELYDFLLSEVPDRKKAWDCGTGNGQIAHELAKEFDQVYATDISQEQISNAPENAKVAYSVQRSELTSFPDDFFDLVTVGQAIHWFDFEGFYREVNRTTRQEGILAVIGYGLIKTFREADLLIQDLYHNIVGPYWDKERRFVEDNYQSIPFPFQEVDGIPVENRLEWSLDHLVGYLETWSASKHYQKAKNQNPIDLIYGDLERCWGRTGKRTISFPIFFRVGRIHKGSSQ